MNSIQINTTENATVDALLSDTEYVFTASSNITSASGFAINANSQATDRTIYVDGELHGGGGIDVGDGKSGEGGGQLYIGSTAVIDVANTGVYAEGDNQEMVTAGHISGVTGMYAGGATNSIWNSGTIHGVLTGIYMAGANETVRNSGLLLAPEALVLGGGADTKNHILNSGAITGSISAITGSDGADVIRNTGLITGKVDLGAGNDTFNTRGGAVIGVVHGGLGDDHYILSGHKTHISEAAGEGIDTVKSSITCTLGKNIENLTLTGSKQLTGEGNALSNHLTGNAAVNVLDGGVGKDTLDGGRDSDFLTGGGGADTFVFAKHSGHDAVMDFQVAGTGHDRIDLSHMHGFDSFADLASHLEQHGKDAAIDFGHGDVLTLRNTDMHDLSAQDFHF